MNYDQTRDAEQLRVLADATEAFIARSKANPAQDGRQTVFLFVGGEAAQLRRATIPFQENAQQSFVYDTVWLTPESFVGGALDLAMQKQSDGSFRDLDDRIVIADGSVGYEGCTPYTLFTDWCGASGLDWFVFGWDWRRRLEDSAEFFVGQFLAAFQAQVSASGAPDPLVRFSLVGHSFGGMVVDLVNRCADPILGTMWRAITAGAPFYGYSGQIHRWFEGDPYFNGPFNVLEAQVIQTLTSFPSGYTLPFLDEDTFTKNQAALGADIFPLPNYPSVDATTPATRVDPFDPPIVNPNQRYPSNTGFDLDELTHGRTIYQLVASPMPDGAAQDRFYCVRCVRPVDDTLGGITWHTLAAGYNPAASASPIVDDPTMVPGDDTQPAWTARLVCQPEGQIVTLEADVDHAFMMEYRQVQAEIGKILGLTPAAIAAVEERLAAAHRSAVFPHRNVASSGEAINAIHRLQALQAANRPTPDREAIHAFLAKFSSEQRRAIARRVLKDIMRGPRNTKADRPSEAEPPTDRTHHPTEDGKEP